VQSRRCCVRMERSKGITTVRRKKAFLLIVAVFAMSLIAA
jgi:hypothetical protein